MICQVKIGADGEVAAYIDTDDIPADDDERTLLGLTTENLLDLASKAAITAWLDLRAAIEGE